MTKITSKKRAWCIILALIPVFIAVSCAFSTKSDEPVVENPAVENPVFDLEQIITRGNGVSSELISEYQMIVGKYLEKSVTGNSDEFDKFYWNTNQLPEEDWVRLYCIFVQMDGNQKSEQKIRFGEAPRYYENRKASKIHQYDGWKRDKNCIVWIDGKKVDKSILDSYDRTDLFAFHLSDFSKGENDFNFRVDYWTEDGFKAFSKQMFEQPVSIGKLLEIKPNIQFVMEQKNDDFVYVYKNYGSQRGWFEASIMVAKKETEWYSSSRTTNGGSSPLSYHRNKESGVDKAGHCNCD